MPCVLVSGRVAAENGVLVDAAVEAIGVSTATESLVQSQNSSEDMQRSLEASVPQPRNVETNKDSGSHKRASNPAIHDKLTRKKVSISALSNEGNEKEKCLRTLTNRKGGRKRDCKNADLQQAVTDGLEIEGKKANTRSRVKRT